MKKLIKSLKFIFFIFLLVFSCSLTQVKAIDYIDGGEAGGILEWGFSHANVTTGYYTITSHGITYPFHVYVYQGDTTLTANTTFGDANDIGNASRNAVNGVLVIVNGDLTIQSGVTVTAATSSYGGPKGLFIVVTGTFTNKGTITMTNRGGKHPGENVYLFLDGTGNPIFVPARGANGGATRYSSSYSSPQNGYGGAAGSGRATGGGGAGAANHKSNSGVGGAGTSYSGGAGGGGAWNGRTGGAGSSAGAAGGAGSAASLYTYGAGGGAGNPGGAHVSNGSNGANGTGGLLALFGSNFTNTGSITSNGAAGGAAYRSGGGGSGGGSINIFYSGTYSNTGSVTVNAGAGGRGTRGGGETASGGAGGRGTANSTQVVLEPEYLHPTLSYLKVNTKDVTPVYTPENRNYSFNLDSEDYRVNVDAQVTNLNNNIESGIGLVDIPAGGYTHEIVIKSFIGSVDKYYIEFYRAPSPYKYLRNISLDGVNIEGFSPTKFVYDLNVDSTVEVLNIEAILGRPSQSVSGDGEVEIKSGMNVIELSVMSEDMTSTVIYTLNIYKARSTLLKVLSSDRFDLLDTNGELVEFDPHVTEYNMEMFAGTLSVDITAIPYDSEATVTLFGFSYIRKTINATVTVSVPGLEDTVYHIKILKGEDVDVYYEYPYTGKYQVFEAPVSAFYKIELWGAQGGNSRGNNSVKCSYNRGTAYGGGCGGFGAYTSGWLYVRKDTKLYFYIGQRGLDAKPYNNVAGGWNGGGSATYDHSDDEASGSGGGASDVRLVPTSSTTSWNEFDSLKSRIMVAAGGGGGSDVYVGGNGGTLTSANGRYSLGVSQTSGYRFGKGEDGVYRRVNYDVAGGGSGYFGGFSTAKSSSYYSNWGQTGTGGSSYVSGCNGCKSVSDTSTSFNNLVITDENVHPSGYKFKNISMLQGSATQPNVSSGYSVGHVGNGYGKIEILNLSENNYLNNLKVYDVTKKSTIIQSYDIIENQDGTSTPIDENITLNVDSLVTSIKLNGRPDDDTATVNGNGIVYNVEPGANVFTITVVAEDNQERVYTITINREADTKIKPTNIVIKGLVQSLCNQKPDLCILTNSENEEIAFDSDTHEYFITVPSRIKQLRWEVEKAQTNQVVIGELISNLSSGINVITIEIESEACSINYTDEDLQGDESLRNSCISTYTYNVYRDISDDSDLSELYIDSDSIPEDDPGYNVDFDLNYTDYDVFNYYFSVPSDWTYVKYLVAKADAEADGATVTITGNDEGSFETRGETYVVNILVTAPDHVSTSVYKLHVYRELDSNIFLYSIDPYKTSISDDNKIALDKDFTKTIFNYNLVVENDIDSLVFVSDTDVISTTANITVNNSASINTTSSVVNTTRGDNTVSTNRYTSNISNLKTGYTTLSINTTSEKSDTGLYTITIFRKYNSDSSLNSLSVKKGDKVYDLDPLFETNITSYVVNVDPDISEVEISASANKETSSVKYLNNGNIKLGENKKEILVTAEDGTYTIYTLNIIRPASSNNNLSLLKVKGNNNIEYGVDLSDESPYNITVPNEVSYVDISANSESKFATIKGIGRYYLSTQDVNNIIVSVLAEDGTNKAYEINITREKNNNAYLKAINVTNGTLNEIFESTNLDYTVTVPYTVETIKLNGIQSVSTTSITLKDEAENIISPKDNISLTTGTKIFYFTTLAEDQVTSLTYRVSVTKEACTLNTLSNVYVKEASLRPKFNPDETSYNIKVPYDIDEVNFVIKKAHYSENYTLSSDDVDILIDGDKVSNLKLGENIINISVTPEDGVVKVYTFIIERQPEGTASNYLLSINLTHGTLSPSFDKLITYYEVDLPYEISSTSVSCTLDDIDATYTGSGTYSLKDGEDTVVTITVTATDGYTRDYVIVIHREKSTDATLSNLSVNRSTLSPSFNSSITEYNISTTNSSLVFDSILPTMSESTYEVIGNDEDTFIENGTTYDVIIRVTAPDKVTTKDYVLHVKKTPSKNYNLSSLSVVGYNLSPVFSPNTSSYVVNVEYEVSNVLIEATASDSNATIEGIGVTDIEKGINYREVKVTSESGEVKTYVIRIIRAYSSDNTIKDIILNNANFVDNNGENIDFDSSLNTFNVVMDGLEDELDLNVLLNDVNAKYSISGNDFKDKESGSVVITVTAEDGSVKTYTLNVTKSPIISDLLSDLYDKKYGINPTFNKYVNNYNLVVDYEYTSLDLVTKSYDKNATIEIIDNNLSVGENIVKVKVTASDSSSERIYNINVTRNPEIENFLDYLYTDYNDGDFNEVFDKRVVNYTLTVDSNIESITLYGEPYTKKSIVTTTFNNNVETVNYNESNPNILGNFNLVKGNNTILIKVSLDSVVRTYKVDIYRAFSNLAYLESLLVTNNSNSYQLTPEFDPETFAYTLNVSKDIYTLDLSGEVSPLSKVTGLGKVDLKGGVNTFIITVLAEDNVTKNEYTLTINKEKSDNAFLVDLVPSNGKLEPSFIYDKNAYTMNVDSSVATLSFDYILEDMNATVTGDVLEVVPDGVSTRVITVTAEDGVTTRDYTITINKIISNDAYLKSLTFKNYDFIDKDSINTKVTFDKDVFEYYVLVNNDKVTASISDFTYELNDEHSTVTYSGIIKLVTQNYVQFKFTVTAEDGFTENVYIVNVMRKKSNNSLLASLVVNYGYLTQGFSPNVYSYDWYVPLAASYLDDDSVSVVLSDKNASYVKSEPFDAKTSKEGELSYLVTITSEDGTSTSVYSLRVFIDASSDSTLKSVDLSSGKLEGELTNDVFEYNVHVYEDLTKMKIVGTPNSEAATITTDMDVFLLDLDSEYTEYIITVLAEDGTSSSNYKFKIYRDIHTSQTLKDLSLNGLQDIDTCTSKICTINPAFSEKVLDYRIVVPYEYEVLDVNYLVDNEQQTVKLSIDGNTINNKEYNLPVGETIVNVTVYDGLGAEGKTYNLTVKRNASSNAHLSNIVLSSSKDGNYTLSPSFNRDTFEYRTNASFDVTTLSLVATPEENNATYRVRGLTNLSEGSNMVQVTVTAPDMITKLYYYINVIVKPEFDAYLSNITVFSSVFFDISPSFDETIFSYTSEVYSYSEYALIQASFDSDKNIRVTGEGEYEIKTGINIINLTSELLDENDNVIAESVYTVSVIRPVSSNVYLKDLKVTSNEETELLNQNGYYDLSPKFDRGTTDYRLDVSPGIKKLDITATPGEESFKVRIYGNNLVTGKNIVDIIVVNEDSTLTKTYQLMVNVLPSKDPRLKGITVKNANDDTIYGVSDSEFNPGNKSYSLRVPYNVDKVIIEGAPIIDASVITGNGLYYLDYGDNTIILEVLAEDGESTDSYSINIFREYDLYLENIQEDNNDYDLNEEFDKLNETYTMNVDNSVKQIELKGIPEESNVRVTYSIDSGSTELATITEDGVLYTGVGLNKVVITVTAPDNTFKKYFVNVMREQSDNNYLEYLEFDEGIFREPFEKTKQEYSMYILDTYTSLDLSKAEIIPEDSTATYAVSGYAGLSKTASNIVTVAVTSESGKVRNYTIEVILKPESFFMHYLKSLKLSYKVTNENVTETNEATLSPIFAQNIRNYTVTVPYSVSSITINAIPLNDDDDAIISASTESGESFGDATYPLNFGRNVLSVKVTSRLSSSDGSFGMYKVIVYRSMNAVATLQHLDAGAYAMNPTFNSNRTSYSIDIDSSVDKLNITALPTDPGATVEIIGNGNFHEGVNTITIKVTAADNKTIKNYYIIANCTLSNNNYLSELVVRDHVLSPLFDKTNTGVYIVNTSEFETNALVVAKPDKSTSKVKMITSLGEYETTSKLLKLNPGNNFVNVQVTADSGDIRVYTLNIFRSYSTDNTLRELVVSDGILVPEFNSEVLDYTVTLDGDLALLDDVTVIGIKNDSRATVIGNGEYNLNSSRTKVVIKVKAESGDIREYNVTFVKEEIPSTKLKELSVYEGELEPEFNNEGYKYYLTVPYEITSLNFDTLDKAIPEDESATVEILNNENFKVGINVVTIKVTASNENYSNYYIYVTRSIDGNTYLKDLYVDNQTLSPIFDEDTLYYELTVSYSTESIVVNAFAQNDKATVSINSKNTNKNTVNLNYGENKVYVNVITNTGAERTYVIKVTRVLNEDNYLLTLTSDIGEWDKTFDKEINEYTINVPAKTKSIVLSGTTSVGSSVTGLGTVDLSEGENTHLVSVTNDSGLVNNYNITIIRPGASDASIISITSNQGPLTLEDYIYKISVDNDIATIKFTVETSDPDASVDMKDLYNLDYNDNNFVIIVTAEDGVTKNELHINVYRYKNIESVNIIEESAAIGVDETFIAEYEYAPLNTDYKEFTWTSMNNEVASVDQNGKITGISEGITYVYITSTVDESVRDYILVYVSNKIITSSIYTVWHLGESENNLANVDFSYVIDANDKTTVEDFVMNFDNNPDNLVVKSLDERVNNGDYVGSGMKLQLVINNHVYDELVIVVRGDNGSVDKPGNGIITSTDYATLSSLLAGLTIKTPMTSLLYDLNKNKILTVTDLSPLSLYIAGKATFTNLNDL